MDDFRGNWGWLENSMVETDEQDNIVFGATYYGGDDNYVEWRGDTIVREDNIHGERVIFLARLDPQGNLLWHKLIRIDGSIELRELKTDHQNNVILIVESENSFDAFQQHFEQGYTLLKLDPNGEFLWSQHLRGATQHLFAAGHLLSIACDNAIILAGSVGQVPYDSFVYEIIGWDTLFWYLYKFDTLHLDGQHFAADTNNIFIARLNPEGHLGWLKLFEHNGGLDVRAVDGSYPHRISLLGSYRHEDWPIFNTILPVDTIDYYHKDNMFILTLDENGDVQWIHKYFNDAYPYHIAYDYDANIIVAGGFHTETYSDQDTITEEHNSGDLLIFKTDSLGRYLWGTHTGDQTTNQGAVVAANPKGEIYLTGGLSGNIGPILNKYNTEGDELWSISPVGNSNRDDEDLALDRSGHLILVGFFSGDFKLGNQTLEFDGIRNFNFIIKFDSEQNPDQLSICETVTALDMQEKDENGFAIYPNPATQSIVFEGLSFTKGLTLGIYDMDGNLVVKEMQNEHDLLKIDVSNWPAGLYVAHLTSTDIHLIKKFIVIR